MTVADVVLETIEAWPHGICDACLVFATGITPHQLVNATCRSLELRKLIKRDKHYQVTCGRCGKVRMLNRTIQGDRDIKLSDAAQLQVIRREVPTPDVEFLDKLRRGIIQYLNSIDPDSSRVSFSRRAQDLRNRGLLSSTLASLMLTHAAYRNAMYYERFNPTEIEGKFLCLLDACLRSLMTKIAERPRR